MFLALYYPWMFRVCAVVPLAWDGSIVFGVFVRKKCWEGFTVIIKMLCHLYFISPIPNRDVHNKLLAKTYCETTRETTSEAQLQDCLERFSITTIVIAFREYCT